MAGYLAFLRSKLLLSWGFSVRQKGASASQLAYPLPPPTTVVGAFAAPASRILGVPDVRPVRTEKLVTRGFKCFLEATLAAGAGILPASPTGTAVYEEPTRLVGIIYKGGNDAIKAARQPVYVSLEKLMPVQAVGSASAPGALLEIAWLVDVDALSACLGKDRRDVEYALDAAPLAVYRLGSREGLAAALEGGAALGGEVEVQRGGVYTSRYYQDSECAEPRSPGDSAAVILPGLDYTERVFHVPSGPLGGEPAIAPPIREARFSLNEGCSAARPSGDESATLAFRAGVSRPGG